MSIVTPNGKLIHFKIIPVNNPILNSRYLVEVRDKDQSPLCSYYAEDELHAGRIVMGLKEFYLNYYSN